LSEVKVPIVLARKTIEATTLELLFILALVLAFFALEVNFLDGVLDEYIVSVFIQIPFVVIKLWS
jgi:hypothetical protein